MSTEAFWTLVVRIGLVLLFLPFSAADKLFNFNGALAQASQRFKPRMLAVTVIAFGLGIEIVMSLAVVSGIADRLAALVLAGYCALTALLFKPFWASGDFWASGQSRGRLLFWDFLKNCSLGSGFLLITIAPGGQGVALLLSDPFGSTRPFG